MRDPRIILQSPASTSGWWDFSDVVEMVAATSVEKIEPLLSRVSEWVDRGGWAAGILSYEAAPAFEPTFATLGPAADGPPLAWFALVRRPREVTLPVGKAVQLPNWRAKVAKADYLAKIEEIHRQIALGNTYQVNITVPLQASNPPDPWSWFLASLSSHRRSCQAFIEIPDPARHRPWSIISLSPELFFRLDGKRIWSRPMKGTARPGRDLDETMASARQLASSEKNRAENVMIVDMVRNDLGRIAEPGSVEVPEIFQIEHHPTVLQMTSTVSALTDATLEKIFSALFPCASITGAPKISTATVISALEVQPRGIYTGAIGWVGPNRQARFGVAIRTAVVDGERQTAEYSVGGGVVWDSVAEDEFAECATKARIVSRPQPSYQLLETLLWEPTRGAVLASQHRRRLKDSARHFGVEVDTSVLSQEIEALVDDKRPSTAFPVRITAEPNQPIRASRTDLGPNPDRSVVCFATLDVSIDDPRVWHKTTSREPYQHALGSQPGVDDVLLINRDGEVTESTIANLVLFLDGKWLTPRRVAGCLNGTLRSMLLQAGVIEEAQVTPSMVRKAQRLYLINSVRGWIPTRLVESEQGPA